LSNVEHEYAKHNIKLIKLPSVEMDFMPNIGLSDDITFIAQARNAFSKSQAAEKQPHAVAIAYTAHLAVKIANHPVKKTSVRVGPGSPPVFVAIVTEDESSILPELRYLWQGLVPGDSWFVSAKFLRQGGTAADSISIPAIKCTAVPTGSGSPLRSNVVRVDVNSLPAGSGTIVLLVNIVDRMRGGFSFPGTNLVCVCTMAWWTAIDTKAQNQTIVHELGHAVGMVADGSGKLPDKTATWYDTSKGHFGNHCFYGIVANQTRYDSGADLARSRCVMYGAANGIGAFCANCAPAVCKVDLSDGWRPFL
jgi:type VI secretion system secreted protein VgrG